jgi:beta-glucanase (GH16 family)
MKKSFLLLATCLATFLAYSQPNLNIVKQDYTLDVCDEFTYSSISPTSNPAFADWDHRSDVAMWWLQGEGNRWMGWDSGNYVYYNPSLVTVTGAGKIRLNESSSIVDVPYDSAHSFVDHTAGMFESRYLPSWGIIEANMKLPKGTKKWPAFWLFGSNGTEIDICEGADSCHIAFTIHDWERVDGVVTRDEMLKFESTHQFYCSGLGIDDLSDDFHRYAVVWDPYKVDFYFDDVFKTSITYDDIRLFPEWMKIIEGAFSPSDSSYDQHMDIDYIKVYRKKCNGLDYNFNSFVLDDDIQTYSLFSSGLIRAGLKKYRSMTLDCSTCAPATQKFIPTVWEGQSITILPNFVSDQSNLYKHNYTYSNGNIHEVIQNGYFLIQSSPCCLDDIVGPDIICTDAGHPFYYTHSISGGTWETNNPYVVIHPVLGYAISSISFSGYVKITYRVGGCSISKEVLVKSCTGESPPTESKTTNSNSDIPTPDPNIGAGARLAIFPNPTQSTITISYPCKQAGQLEISIKDVSGRVMHTESVTCAEGGNVQQVVDIHDYAPGVYFVDLTLNGEHTVKKIVKL